MRRHLPMLAAGLVAILAAGCSASPAVDGAAAGSTATVTVAPSDPTAVTVPTTVTATTTVLVPTTIRVLTTVPAPTTATVTSTATETVTEGVPGQAADAPAAQAPAPDPATPQAPVQQPAVQGPFANCTEARAAGAAPVHRGEPGYADKLDRDGDGVGCES